MAFVLTKRYEDLVLRLIQTGRYNNRSEVVRAGLRLLEEKELGYLPHGSLPPDKLEEFYGSQSALERQVALRAVTASLQPHQMP
jgi:hypothetical protein